MPISPSALEWWGWLLIALGAAIAAAVIGLATHDEDGTAGCLGPLIAWLFGLAALVTFIIGVIRFVKWVWNA